MALGIVILALSSVLLLGFSLRSRYGLPLFLMTVGMGIVSVAVLCQIYSVSMYSPPAYFPLRDLDIRLFRFIGSRRIPAARLQTIRCMGCLLFFGGVLVLLLLMIRNVKRQAARKNWMIFFCAFFLLLSAAFALFYSPASAYRLYLRYYALKGAEQARFRLWIGRLDIALRGLIFLFVSFPEVFLLLQYWKRNITYFADTMLLLLFTAALYGGLFCAMFFTGPFIQRAEAVFRSGFWFYFSDVRVPTWIALIFPLFSLLLLLAILVNARRVFNGELVLLTRRKAMKNSIEELNRNLKDVFHSEKNLMFSMRILAEEAKAAYGTPEGLEKLDRLSELARRRMESITSSLNRIRELHLNALPVDMRQVADLALSDLALPEDIRLEKRYCDYPARCVIDEYHTRSALKNLFMNAIEALQVSERKEKHIEVAVDASREWVSLSVRDNGTGIEKKELRRVMLPFVSTKSKTANWGIGLSYVFRVVSAQLGQMRIQSSDKPDASYTQVDILLPRERRSDR